MPAACEVGVIALKMGLILRVAWRPRRDAAGL